MLVLTRKKDEIIVINGNIKIRVVDLQSDCVKIGIDAPSAVKIYRQEVWDNIQAENIVAMEKAKDHTTQDITTKLGKKIKDVKDKQEI